ncbi:hypothetical protein GPECTOR_33g638 [Gonium pectorale]|uniref:SAP domain-containing protein n=1 Tax=Gonium pectorale TaxID=33097 RepID=A0A150GD43_GONPE|nr:hypothetical protein GPECTOR_33g638 [Gonium pectorale]|eukprot:KXZ47756.1 hypothetical protein GPECTOR_33g638 [Gonium pectorale]
MTRVEAEQEVWCDILSRLAASLEPPGGVRGPGVVTADVVRAGATCRDMCRASRTALAGLAAAVPVRPRAPPLTAGMSASDSCPSRAPRVDAPSGVAAGAEAAPSDGVDWQRWEGLLCRPQERKVEELRGALKQLGLPSSGSKAEMALRLLGHFGLSAKCALPPRLWVALMQEREGQAEPFSARLASALRELQEAGHPAALAANREPSLAGARRVLAAAFGNSAGLMAARVAAMPGLMELRAAREGRRRREAEEERAERDRRWAQEQQRWTVKCMEQQRSVARALEERAAAVHGEIASRRALIERGGPVFCPCGNCAAPGCSLLICGSCCRQHRTGACARHSK